jgi:hypothetical protein
VLIDGDGETLLRLFLPNDIFVKKPFDLARLGKWRAGGDAFGLLVVRDDLVADVYALVADVNGWPSDELLHFVLRLAAERTTQRVISSSYHKIIVVSLESEVWESGIVIWNRRAGF